MAANPEIERSNHADTHGPLPHPPYACLPISSREAYVECNNVCEPATIECQNLLVSKTFTYMSMNVLEEEKSKT